MTAMARKQKCVECRYCETRIDEKGVSRQYCATCRNALPANVTSRPACGKFERPPAAEYWGP